MATAESVLDKIKSFLNGTGNPNLTLNGILSEMAAIEWDIPPGKTVLLYSGDVMSPDAVNREERFSKAFETVQAMKSGNGSLFIDSDTGIGKVLTDPDFREFADARKAIEGISDAALDDSIHDLWSTASQQLASKASGDVITISPFAQMTNARGATVFSSIELPALLANPNVTSIDGIPKSALADLASNVRSQALAGGATAAAAEELVRKEVLDLVSSQSLSNMKGKVQFGEAGGIRVSPEFFPNGTPAAASGIDTVSGSSTFAFEEVAKPLEDADFQRLAKTGTFLRGLKVAGTYGGPIGDVLAIAVAAVTIKHLYDIGDKEGAAREAAKATTSLLTGAAGAAAAAELLSPMLMGGPIGITAYVVLVGGAGVVSSIAGENIVDLLFNGGSGVFYGRDGLGLFVDVYQRDANGELQVIRARQRVDSDEIRVGTFEPGDQGEIVVTARPDGSIRAAFVKFRDPVSGEAELVVSAELLGDLANALKGFLDRGGTLIGGAVGGGSWGGSDPASSASVAETPSGKLPALSVVRNQDGTISLNGRTVRAVAEDPRNPNAVIISPPTSIDEFGREVSLDLYFDGQELHETGVKRVRDGSVIIRTEEGQPTTIRLADSEIGLDFVNSSEIIASVFGRYFIGGGVVTQTISSAVISTLAANFGDVLNALVFDSGVNTASNIEQAFSGIGEEFLANLQGAGIGALSAMITAELMDELGIEGIPGQAAGSIANYTLNIIANNISEIIGGSDVGVFDGIGDIDSFKIGIGNLAGSFIGSTLANEIASWDEVGEQIGSSIGTSLGSVVGQTAIPIPVLGAAIGSLLGNLLGGLIGGVFTGTPKSGAIVEFDTATGEFLVSEVWKEDGGKRAAARELGNMAANSINGIVEKIGGTLVNGAEIDAGSYGMRGKRYIYWEDDFNSTNRVKFKDAGDLIEYGVMNAVKDFQLLGGDIFRKRAFFATIESGYKDGASSDDTTDPDGLVTSVDFGLDVLLGNLAVADRLKTYLALSSSVNALIAAEPNSAFAADWLLVFSRISELGLFKRNEHDWDGGFAYLVNQAKADARDVKFRFETLGNDRRNGERSIYIGSKALDDTVDTRAKTIQEGTSASDIIRTGNPVPVANVVRAGAGDDLVIAGDTGDDLFGEDGNDILIGGKLDDWIFGGAGDDVLFAGTGSGNLLSGDAGNDFLVGADGLSDIFDPGSDWLIGGSGNDAIEGRGGGDHIEGGLGNDRVDGGEGDDTFIYRSGDGVDHVSDTGLGAADRDTLEFGHGIEQNEILVVARSSGEAISLFVGEIAAGDRLDLRGVSFGTVSGIDQVSFVTGAWSRGDLISRAVFSKNAGSNIVGTAADQELSGTIHNDRLNGGGGNDRLAGGLGSDIYTFDLGGGADIISDIGFASDLDVLEFGVGISAADISVSWSATTPRDITLSIAGGQGSVTLAGQSLTDGENAIEEIRFVDGTSWTLRDIFARIPLVPTNGADVLQGTHLAERIVGLDGNDQLTGGLGNDYLDGSWGSDTYFYNLGDGHDRIYDDRTGESGSVNRLVLGAGITTANIILVRDPADANDLRISFAGHEGSILLDNQFYTSDWRGGLYDSGFDAIEFADGTVWNRAQLFGQLLAADSTANKDSVIGSRYADLLSTGAGNDYVTAGEGNDQLTGGQGNDYLDGSWGSDTYFYNLGDGHDRIQDVRREDAASINRLVLGAGITISNIILVRDPADANSLRVSFAGHEGSIALLGQFYTDDYRGGRYDRGFDAIEFADGTVWNRAQLFGQLLAADSTANKDSVIGSRYADILSTGAGNDHVTAGEGDDRLTGGQGNDFVAGGTGNDTYVFNLGDGQDIIYDYAWSSADAIEFGVGIAAGDVTVSRINNDLLLRIAGTTDQILIQNGALTDTAIEQIRFADGTAWNHATVLANAGSSAGSTTTGTSGADVITGGSTNDKLVGNSGADRLIGGTGDDYLSGGYDSDTYVFNLGDGRDIVDDYGPNSIDKIELGAGIAPGDVIVTQLNDGGDFLLSIAGTNDQIHIVGGNTIVGTWSGIEEVRFANGTVWGPAELLGQATQPTDGDDRFFGNAGSQTLEGQAGEDALWGRAGADRLIGGTGDDYLSGGADGDTYVFNRGDGRDVIDDYGPSGIDRIEFGAGISASDVIVTQMNDGADFLLSVAGTNDQIQIIGGMETASGWRAIEEVSFADGTVWGLADLLQQATRPTAGDDRYYGNAYAQTLEGQGGEDAFWGREGADRLIGGKGDDYLSGGGDGDTYVFNRGDGRDVIDDYGPNGIDRIEFGPGIAASDIIFTQMNGGADFLLSIIGTNDQIQIVGGTEAAGGWRAIEEVRFNDGTIITLADLRLLTSGTTINGAARPVTMGDDQVFGTTVGDTIRAMGGDDALRGGAGSDTYIFRRGDGYDTLYDPTDATATDVLVLEGINSTDVRVITSPTDAQDIVLYIDDRNLIYLDQQKASSTSGVEEVRFADGVSWNRADLLARAGLVPTSGNDTLIGTNFGEVIEGLAGDDLLTGRAGGDTYKYALGDGHDSIVEDGSPSAVASGIEPSSADDRIIFAAGIAAADVRAAHAPGNGNDVLLTFAGNTGSILLKDQNKGNQVGAGIEFLEFADGSTISMKTLLAQSLAFVTTAGADTINGFITSDDLVGGLGSDQLAGGLGSDRYLFSLGDGADVVLERSASTDADELVFGAGISVANLSLRRRADSPNDLVFLIGTSGDEIRLVNQLAEGSGQGVELVRFHDGTTWNRDQLLAHYGTQPATSDADFIMGGDADNLFAGLGGDDIIEGGAGDDVLNGGDGDDDLRGGRGDDILIGGDGDDILSGGTGVDEFGGGAGLDTLDYSFSLDDWSIDLTAGTASIITSGTAAGQETFTGIEAVVGGMGQDHLIGDDFGNRFEGSENDDVLNGAGGDDVFVYRGSETGLDTLSGGAGHDRIEAAENDTVIGLTSINGIEEISANGFANVSITGTDEADVLDFGAVAVDGITQVYLAAGDDIFTGSGGFASVDLGLGNDVYKVSGNYGAVGVEGGDGLDRIEAIADNSVIGLKSLAGIEQISAGSHANVTIVGSGQADILSFTAVSLTGILRIDGGDGADTITGSAQADVIRGGAGDDILAGGDGDDIFEITSAVDGADTVNGGNGSDQIRVTSLGLAVRLAAPPVGVEAIYGMSSELIFGGMNDSINLSGVTLSGIVSIDGGAGTDTIIGSAGSDLILAGLGNDTLTGNGGNDTYIFNLGDGQDVVQEYVSTSGGGSGGADALVFGAGIVAEDVAISRSGNDVILTIVSTGEKVTIKNQASDTTSHWIEEVRFADGTIWDRATTIGTALYGTAAADILTGTSAADTIFGLDGDDVLSGAAGTDRLYGGSGNDMISGGATDDGLYGGAGDDIFQYGAAGDGYDDVGGGDGLDTIVATANNAWIGLRSITGIEAISSGGYSNVAVWGSTAADVLSFAAVTLSGIVKIDGYDGNDVLTGSAGADTIVGGSGNDLIAGGLDNDSIDGGSGTDTADFSARTNAWTINLSAVSSHAQSGSEIDTLISIENVIGGSGADTITGTTAANVLDGGDGNDVLRGNAGNDTLIGGSGNDIAVFAGLQASYSIVTGGGSIQIVDNQASVDGNDGTDTLSGVETAEFKNGVQVSLSSPIVLDLDGDGTELVDRSLSMARFDWTGDGIRDATGWIGSGDGFLALDRNGDGTVTDAKELSFVDDKYGAKSDLDGLSAFDTNGDGMLSVADQAWGSFHVWKDTNGDAVVGTGEYLSMSQAGIRAINLSGTATQQSWGWDDNVVVNIGTSVRADGSTAALVDVALNFVAGSAGGAESTVGSEFSPEDESSNMALSPERQALRDMRGVRLNFGFVDGSYSHERLRPDFFNSELWSGGSARIDVGNGTQAADIDQKLAAIIQEMGSFGVRPAGEMSGWSRGNNPILELFA